MVGSGPVEAVEEEDSGGGLGWVVVVGARVLDARARVIPARFGSAATGSVVVVVVVEVDIGCGPVPAPASSRVPLPSFSGVRRALGTSGVEVDRVNVGGSARRVREVGVVVAAVVVVTTLLLLGCDECRWLWV